MSIYFCKTKSQFWERGNLREGDLLEDPDVDGRIILKWIFKTWDGGLGQRQVSGAFECGNELSGSIKFGELVG
jgi:hypothetical protein